MYIIVSHELGGVVSYNKSLRPWLRISCHFTASLFLQYTHVYANQEVPWFVHVYIHYDQLYKRQYMISHSGDRRVV